MKSALELVAFGKGCHFEGTLALLDVALDSLDRAGHARAAAYVDMARHAFLKQEEVDADASLDGMTDFG